MLHMYSDDRYFSQLLSNKAKKNHFLLSNHFSKSFDRVSYVPKKYIEKVNRVLLSIL